MPTSKFSLFTSSLLVLIALTFVSCSSDSNSPTSPAAGIEVQSFSTGTQNEPGGFRLQLRLRVLQGLDALRNASQQGAARAQTCLGGMCVEEAVTGNFMEASCPVMGAQTEVWIGSAWLNGDVIGVDVCVANLPGGDSALETAIFDGFNRSNTVTTQCALSGGQMICGSD